MSATHVDATFYAQVEPEFSRYLNYRADSDGEYDLLGAKIGRVTQKKPGKPAGGTVTIKLTVRIPKAAFYPLRPEAVIVVPEDMTTVTPVEVVAEDPNEEVA